MVQDTIDVIWRQLSIVDKIGRAELVEQCGGGTSLADLFTGARNLAKLLTTIRKSLGSASTSLECQRINPIYTKVAHDSICTDAASATAYGFLFFLILGISTMILISLRASWLKNVEEEKVYHDENEIAENMILDEHEEYLAYISRYKHEWQEYHGFEATSVVQSNAPSSYRDDESEGSMYFEDLSQEQSQSDSESVEWSKEGSDAASDENDGPAGLHVEIFSSSFHNRSIQDGARSCAIDEISFQSFSADKSEEESIGVSIREEELFSGPSPLLPPAENPDFREDAPDMILIPSTEIILKDSRLKKMSSWSSSKSKSSKSVKSSGSGEHSSTNHKRTAKAGFGLQINPKESALSFHERPDTPAAAAVARSRTATRAEGEGSMRRTRTTSMSPANVASTEDKGGQTRNRTSTWGGGDSPSISIQKAASSVELKTGDNGLERRHSFGGKRVMGPSNSSTRSSKSPSRTENSEKAGSSEKNKKQQAESGQLDSGLVEL
jgi:hypothetical protein